MDGNFRFSTVSCIILCDTQILYFMRYRLHLAGNNQTHGTIKRSSKIRSRPHRSSVAPSSQVKHASNLRSLDHKYFDHNHIADFKPLSQLWFLEVPTRCWLWFLGHPLREICPDHHSLSTGSEDRGGGSEAGGAHLDSDKCLRPS